MQREVENKGLRHKICFSVATYNIHRCTGLDGRQDLNRIAEVIRELDATIVGLQEVAFNHGKDTNSNQLAYIAGATGLQAVATSAALHRSAAYGNSLLIKEGLVKIRHHDLSLPGRKPRGAIEAELEIGGMLVRIVVAHFGLRNSERYIQARRILAIISSQPGFPTILLGDFNEWFQGSAFLRLFSEHFGDTPVRRTFPSRFPVLALDRIWVAPKESLLELEVHDNSKARIASDHLPLKAKVAFFDDGV